jgi:hypothetical protein
MFNAGAVFGAGGLACANPDKGTIEVVATARVATRAQGDPSFIELLHEFHF